VYWSAFKLCFGFGPATRIYLAAGATDMRKSFEGLYGLVRDRLTDYSASPEVATYFCFVTDSAIA
jgi:hypothetical protein